MNTDAHDCNLKENKGTLNWLGLRKKRLSFFFISPDRDQLVLQNVIFLQFGIIPVQKNSCMNKSWQEISFSRMEISYFHG